MKAGVEADTKENIINAYKKTGLYNAVHDFDIYPPDADFAIPGSRL